MNPGSKFRVVVVRTKDREEPSQAVGRFGRDRDIRDPSEPSDVSICINRLLEIHCSRRSGFKGVEYS